MERYALRRTAGTKFLGNYIYSTHRRKDRHFSDFRNVQEVWAYPVMWDFDCLSALLEEA